ncbi:MAG TPA: hypothetical protein VLS93_02180 [Anaeromyxobacteraceae bacterium]|nr:hypothetical protein [Anaeromyxobacteraceae bacterium]
MGFLGKLFGGGKELPPLDPASPDAARLQKFRAILDGWVPKIHDKIEVVPTDRFLLAFIGLPPDRFGVAWFEPDGAEHNFKKLMASKGLTVREVNAISESLRKAYRAHEAEPRYSLEIAGKKIKVTPSLALAKDVDEIVHKLTG